jgi:hypothetical protein
MRQGTPRGSHTSAWRCPPADVNAWQAPLTQLVPPICGSDWMHDLRLAKGNSGFSILALEACRSRRAASTMREPWKDVVECHDGITCFRRLA